MTEKELQVFDFEGNTVRTVFGPDGEPWWVARDVCAVLGINKYRDAVSRLDDDERDTCVVATAGGPRQMVVISETGLYSLVLTSRKPSTRKFKRWLTREALPSFRYETEGLDVQSDEMLIAIERLRWNRLSTLDLKRRIAAAETTVNEALGKAGAALSEHNFHPKCALDLWAESRRGDRAERTGGDHDQ